MPWRAVSYTHLAKDRDLPLDVLKLVRDKYDELAAAGGGDEGTQALIQVLRK